MKKIEVYIPLDYKDVVKKALFDSGAGQLGHYKNCCFESRGMGQFFPDKDSIPFIGEKNKMSYVEEVKVELLCKDEFLSQAISNMKKAHPYEEPAYFIIAVN